MPILSLMIETLDDILAMLEGWKLFGNSARQYLLALALFLAILVFVRIFKRIIIFNVKKIAKRTKTNIDDRLVVVIENVSGFFYFALSLYFPLRLLVINPLADQWISGAFMVIVVVEVVKLLQRMILFGLRMSLERSKNKKAANETTLAAFSMVVKLVLWTTGGLLILSNLGFNINSLVASLGIGGVAVALALQNILTDIFSSFSIYFDKPFEVGDYITLGTDGGTVKKIGLKTTRLCTLQGEELVISNQELTSARLQNFKKMKRRRPDFKLGLAYETPTKKLRLVDGIVKKVIDGVEGADFDRCNFVEFGDFSLNFHIVYFVDSAVMKDYAEKQEQINLGILDSFEKEGIAMAYPTQTIYMKK
jgi:small-conductance mechanosensitive channel